MLQQWIASGASHPDARGKPPAARPVRDRKSLEAARQFWSFIPPRQAELPTVRDGSWPRTPVDYFVLSALERAGLNPAPAADRRTWLRRVTFDLTGLPPTPGDVQGFLGDTSPNAHRRVVDRLLASPRHGERWGRHWLDVARYADSNGLDENVAYGNAWRYRDYVIRSFNEDQSYDQFLCEQLAGDCLAAKNDAEQRRQLVATGFLALGPKVLAEVDETKMEMDIIDEQIDTLGRALLGLTFGCARCHDHKFDPISMRDYYALAGIFKSTRTMEHFRKIARWHENAIPTSQQQEAFQRRQKQVADQKRAIEQFVAAANKALLGSLEPAAKLPDDAQQKYPEDTRKQLKELQGELKKLEEQGPTLPTAMGVSGRESQDVPIHVRGSHLTLGPIVPRGFPEVLAASSGDVVPDDSSGRLELARWLTSSDHPLTSRVMVNRIWRWHFGQGICRSTDNFGRLGARPDNPQLLDYLAVRFRRDGWSIKDMHRLIVLSSTYRMSSDLNARAAGLDPDNRLLWRFPIHRLEAESIRDALLFVSGGLDLQMGGSLLHVGNREFIFNHTSEDGTNYDSPLRSVYLPVVRNHLYDVFQLFDYADASMLNGSRSSTTIAPQALFMMNSELVQDAAARIADALLSQNQLTDPQRVDRLYETVYGRLPDDGERKRVLERLQRLASLPPELEADKTEADKTEAGSGPNGNDGRLRAWRILCHVVLASNEFIYLR